MKPTPSIPRPPGTTAKPEYSVLHAQATSEALIAFLFLLSVIIVLSAATNRFTGAVQTQLAKASQTQSATLEHFKRDFYASRTRDSSQLPPNLAPCAQTGPDACSDFNSQDSGQTQTYQVSLDVPI